jgi:ATP-dependent helicase HrpB
LTERGLGGDAVDLTRRLDAFRRDRSPRAEDSRRLARNLASRATALVAGKRVGEATPGALLAAAFPDRIAMARGKPGEFLMANGRAAAVEAHDPLAGESFLAIGEIVGRAASARILTAAPLTREEIEQVAGGSIVSGDQLTFDHAAAALRARRRRRLGALVLTEQTASVPADEASALALAGGVLSLGVARLPWTQSLKQWRDRVLFLRRAEEGVWPDLSDEALAALPNWLAPFLHGKTSLAEIGAEDLARALHAQLDHRLLRRLESEAPTHFTAPTGTEAAVDYQAEGGPSIALRVQELFGLSTHPALAGGRVPLILHLLSPAHRPIQITRDLPGFWRGSWSAVRADLRGRYPRHFWPENPAEAVPTTRAKPRGT